MPVVRSELSNVHVGKPPELSLVQQHDLSVREYDERVTELHSDVPVFALGRPFDANLRDVLPVELLRRRPRRPTAVLPLRNGLLDLHRPQLKLFR